MLQHALVDFSASQRSRRGAHRGAPKRGSLIYKKTDNGAQDHQTLSPQTLTAFDDDDACHRHRYKQQHEDKSERNNNCRALKQLVLSGLEKCLALKQLVLSGLDKCLALKQFVLSGLDNCQDVASHRSSEVL